MSVIRLSAAASPATVGGKAANLARLIAAGAPVPDGFVLTTHALEHFIAEQERQRGEIDDLVIREWTQLAADRGTSRDNSTQSPASRQRTRCVPRSSPSGIRSGPNARSPISTRGGRC
jgi:hypothetical protein